jgi:hypothetical protein
MYIGGGISVLPYQTAGKDGGVWQKDYILQK